MTENPSLTQQPILKKRGRKPKSLSINIKKSEPIDSEKEQIIVHLPISIEDVINDNAETDETDSIFIKSDKDFIKNTNVLNSKSDVNIINTIDNTSCNMTQTNENKVKLNSENISVIYKNINKINVYSITFNKSKCLWCKHNFDNIPLQLPEDYYNNTFYCSGNFCSWNCMKSYNIDINDSNTWKRESLIHLMYYKTYNTMKEIPNAPSWLLLEDFGGILSITKFRELFIMNSMDYLVLHPPLISRQLQIEESYKKSSNTMSNVHDGELVLKRSKPIETSVSNLEKLMNLKRKTHKV